MRILMVGLGGIGQRHVRNLTSLLGPEVTFIAYRRRQRSHVLTDQLQIEPRSDVETKYQIRAFRDLDEALREKPDVAVICNPSSLHLSVAVKAAQGGCHLFIEKPLSDSLDGVEDLIGLVEREGVVGYVGYQMRFHPCLRRVRALLLERSVGRITAVRAEVGEYLPGWHSYEDYRQMYAARRELGGGVILSQVHELDYLYWFFGLPRRIFALGGHLTRLEVDVEDTSSILMECVVDGRCIPVHLHQDYIQRPASRTCEIIGDEGKLMVDLQNLTLRWYDAGGNVREEVSYDGFERNQLFLDELRHFLGCVSGQERPLVDLREGAQSLRMAVAAKESLNSGKVVAL